MVILPFKIFLKIKGIKIIEFLHQKLSVNKEGKSGSPHVRLHELAEISTVLLTAPVEQRVDDLLRQMTTKEKAALASGKLKQEVVDDSVRRIPRVMLSVELFDKPKL
jgi:hypothetical protein